MKKYLLSAFSAIMAFSAVAAPQKQFTGFLTGSSQSLSPGLYHFTPGASGTLTEISAKMFALFGGAYGDHNYWCQLGYDTSGNMMAGFYAFDPSDGSVNRNDNSRTWGCTDITYDYVSEYLYGVQYIGNEGEGHTLVRIATPKGEITPIAKLPTRFQALACDYWGNLLGMSASGTLYSIDSSTGKITEIGSTGINASTSEVQSMEFDRDSGELFWSFLDTDDNAFIAQVDPATGEIIAKYPSESNALLGGLYIPFTEVTIDAPGSVEGFELSATGSQVTLSWTTAMTTVEGNPLSGNMKVEIRRDGKIVKEYDNVAPGTPDTWTDTQAPEQRKLNYSITCYQDGRRGQSVHASTYLGDDVPAAVGSLTVSAAGAGATLSWTAPTTDRNGQSIDPSTLTYDVVRTPGNKEWTGISSTTFSDNEIPQFGTWSYTVYAVSSLGRGEATTSEAITAGPALEMPWYPDLSKQDTQGGFTILDLDGRGAWIPKNGGFEVNTMNNYAKPAEDWLITPPLHLQAGITYKLSYTLVADRWGEENFRLTIGSSATPEAQTTVLHEELSLQKSKELTQEITVDATGDYNLGFFCNTCSIDAFFLGVQNISIEPIGAVDLAITAFRAPEDMNVGQEAVFTIEVTNKGTEAQSGYSLTLLDDSGNTLASSTISETLEPEQSTELTLSWTPLHAISKVQATVEQPGDVNLKNNISQELTLRFLNASEVITNVGTHDSNPAIAPFNFTDLCSFAQSVYTAEEIGVPGGNITEISWSYNNPGAPLEDKDVKVYMANTALPFNTLNFQGADQARLVYSGKASFLSGENTLTLQLDEPFPYAGGSLLIYTEKLNDQSTDIRVTFAAQNFPDTPRSIFAYGDQPTPDRSKALVSSMLPCITLVLDTDGGTSLTGTVSSGNRNVVGATVTITGAATATLTDGSGHYSFPWLPAGDYELTADSDNYIYLPASASTTVSADNANTCDIELPARPRADLSGIVTDTDGTPVAGAAVIVSGWAKESATTAADGSFKLTGIYSHDALQLDIYATGYRHYTHSGSFNAEENLDASASIEALHNPVTELVAVAAEEAANVIWKQVDFGYDLISDNGNPLMAVESPAYNIYLFGKRFDGPMALYNVSWHSSEASAEPVENIDLYIYGLSEQGAPSSLLFSVTGLQNNENAWNEYLFDTPVIAPYGCIVAFSAEEMIALSQDDQHIPGSYLISMANNSYSPLSDQDGYVNLMIRTHAAFFNNEVGFSEPEVSYNIYRLDDDEQCSTLAENYSDRAFFSDPDWGTIEPGRYRYAVEAVYPDGFTTGKCYSNYLTNNNSGISETGNGAFSVSTMPGKLIITADTSAEVRIFTTSGIAAASISAMPGTNEITLPAGLYIVVSGEHTQKVMIK